MESADVLVGDIISSDNDLTPNSSIINEMPSVQENQNSQTSTNRSSVPNTFMNHERKRSITNIGNNTNNNNSNNDHFWHRSSFSSNEGGSDKPNRSNKQEVFSATSMFEIHSLN